MLLWQPLKRKVGASVVPTRTGSNFVYSAINFFYGINEMTIASSSYWNMNVFRAKKRRLAKV